MKNDSAIQQKASFYDIDKDFRDFIDKYCKKHHISKEEAFTHKIVHYTFNMYHSRTCTITPKNK